MIDSLLVMILTSLACSILGVFLTLRKLSMITDAISHTILLGIVLAFFLTKDLNSPFLIVGASLMGLLTVYLIESLGNSRLVNRDDAIGVVFPFLFSIAVLLISKFAKNAHLDVDVVLVGEVIYAGLNTTQIMGMDISIPLINMALVLVINLVFVLVFYKELKISSFDYEYAGLIGMPVTLLFYGLMVLTSLTSVVAFDAVGAILVISFFIGPPSTALLLADDLKKTLILASIIGAVNSTLAYNIAILTNTSMSGMAAAINLLSYLLVILFNKSGLIAQNLKRKQDKLRLDKDLLLVHIGNHSKDLLMSEENQVGLLKHHLKWPEDRLQEIIGESLEDQVLVISENHYILTDKGRKRYKRICQRYGF